MAERCLPLTAAGRLLLALLVLGAMALPEVTHAEAAGDVPAASPALPHGPHMLQMLSNRSRARPAVPAGTPQGVDVASWQHPNGAPINWGQVAGAGYSFVFIKATEGTYYRNRYLPGDYGAAGSAGLFRAAYAFAAPNASDGASQADYLLNYAPYTYDGRSIPPTVDLEWDPYDSSMPCWGLSTSSMVSWIADFVNEVQLRVGRPPVIYTAASWWNQCTGGSSAFNADPLWIASWGSSSPTLPAGWSSWAFWQWTSRGSVPGISGTTVDLDYFQGGASALAAFAASVVPVWTSVGGAMTSGPSAASGAWNRVDVFARGPQDGGLDHWWWDGAGWGGPESLGGGIASGTGPTAVAWGPNRLDVFVEGMDGELWHRFWSGGWSGWQPLGGRLTASPVVASWSAGRLDIFGRGLDDGLWHMDWDNGWSSWQSLGGTLTSAPGAASWGHGRIDIFASGRDQSMWHMAWSGAWSSWESRGGVLSSAPAASSWGTGRVDVVVLGPTGKPNHRAYAGQWNAWNAVGSIAGNADPGVIDRAPGLVDAFIWGHDNALWYSPVPT
jgi:GH25 family lysozyme M1 (1,4-beta-N-acetylmuramidase)